MSLKNTNLQMINLTPDLKAYVSEFLSSDMFSCFDFSKYTVFPGFCDVHVHFREPGFSYKETILSGSMAAAKGGYTCVCTMPNLNPVPDTKENLNVQLEIIKKDSKIAVYPYASITKGQMGKELSNMEDMKNDAIAFSDDGKGVQSDDMMKSAMQKAKELGKIIVAHCEDNSLLFNGYIHDGEYARKNNHRGISSASEYKQIERDLKLVKEIGCKYHICHISTKESVELIRNAKKEGLDVTCETAPHYLVLDDSSLKEEGRFKMNPPLRSKEDKEALIEGLKDGTIDMIATDHAPHSLEEKGKGLEKSAFGIVGLECAFSVMYTHLVKKSIISLEKLISLMVTNPRKRFNIELGNEFTVWSLDEEIIVDSDEFLSKGKATPFDGEKLLGKCILTVCNEKIAYQEDLFCK
ncbi:MAG: dihydroorotase [Ruminococcaceae bacterium]|nr:dihydroorotase [Oscillospiraceae bacterium]